MKRTEIAEFGEFGLIKHLTNEFVDINESTLIGIGDDAAVLDYKDKEVLVTCDILLEGIHFDLTYTPMKHLGYKAAIVNFSDIYAMNGKPKQLIIALGVSKRFCVEDLEDFYTGLRLACKNYGVDIVGGDTTSSLTGLTISVTCIGEVEKGKKVLRSGAKVNDLICVSGDLGSSYMGLQLLEREKKVFNNDSEAKPDFTGKEYIIERQLKPEARKDIIETLYSKGIVPTSMIDVSDGLSSELLHICTSSNCGCNVYEDKIPIDYQTAAQAEEMNLNLTTVALNGGEDYELLFTVPLSMHEAISEIKTLRVIGHICSLEKGRRLITRDGTEIDIIAQGWKSF
jgi:thiamine-monophosphate kinase